MADQGERPRTPSPSRRVHTPPAPRLGYLDNWDPFTTPKPRKSARISSQQAAKQPVSPHTLNHQNLSAHPTSEDSHQHPTSSEPSPMPPSHKKRQPAPDSVRRAARPFPSTDDASGATGSEMKGKATHRSSASRTKNMLLTPSKTPRKPENGAQAPAFGHVARELFVAENDDLLPTPRKRAKKYTGISMESFTVEEVDDPIDIFTDSRDRIPAKDESEANPFFGEVAEPEPSKRRSKRNVKIPGEGIQSIDAASRREDGMLYVFRGKKFFRKFTEDDSEEVDDLQLDDSDVEEGLTTNLTRPLRRSAIKPRLLFQPNKTPAMIEEEEAPTDIEDNQEPEEEECPQTPVKKQRSKTPEAPKFAPVSPPDTKRTTRSMNKLLDESTPARPYNVRRTSTFDSWRRTKDSKGSSSSKRAGESLASASTKRTRT